MKAEWTDFVPTLRDKILSKARYGEITPEQAEAEAAAHGLPPLEQKPPSDAFAPLNKPHWSIVMAVTWIACRDLDLVREQDWEFRSQCVHWVGGHWKLPVNGGAEFILHEGWSLETPHRPSTLRLEVLDKFKGARAALWAALSEGKLAALALDRSGIPVEIPQREWAYLRLFEEGERDSLKYDPLDREEPYTDIKLKPPDLLGLWPKPSTKVKAKTDCCNWLFQQMRESPLNPVPKSAVWKKARQKFPLLSQRQFLRAWEEAVVKSEAAAWSKAGRRSPKSNRPTK